MKPIIVLKHLWLIGTVFVVLTASAFGAEKPEVEPKKEIPRLSEIQFPARSVQNLVQSPTPNTSPANTVIEVTEVKANPSDKGVEVILQTAKDQQLQLVNRSAGNSFIVDVPNAQLRLPSGDAFTFRSEKPIAGVTEITVTNFDANTIRVTVTGEIALPQVELYDSPDEGLIFSPELGWCISPANLFLSTPVTVNLLTLTQN